MHATAATVLSGWLCFFPALFGERVDPCPASAARVFDGYIEASTAAGGLRTFVTVAAAPGAPLNAAFSVQHGGPAPQVAYRGMGRITLGETSLALNGADDAILFRFPSCAGPVPAGMRAIDVIGIAVYSWPVGGPIAPPSSYEEFAVTQPLWADEDPPPGNDRECVSGGAGARSCSYFGHHVSCYSPYEACCTTVSAYCCRPRDEGEGKKVRPRR